MNTPRKYALLGALVLAFGWTIVLAQQTAKKFASASYGDIHYLEHLPSDYSTSSKQYPLIIFLHGGGEQGPADGTKIDSVKKLGPPKYIEAGDDMTFTVDGQSYSFIVISPQLRYSIGVWPEDYLDAIIASTLDRYRVDRGRIYLTGLSLGGGGTWRYGAKNADLFAAIAPLAGAQSPNRQLAQKIAAESLPVWIFHGANDGKYPSSWASTWAQYLNDAGADPAPKLTIYPGLGHENKVWDNAYRTDNQVHTPNLYEWFLQHQRGSTTPPPPVNQPPVARAGADVTIQLPISQVKLNGGASSDPDGSIAAYAWTKKVGPSGSTLSGQTTATLTASNLTAGTYTFQLQVTDNQGASATDQVQVTVTAPASVVTANAGEDRSVSVNAVVTLSGIGKGPNPFRAYLWEKVSGPSVTMSKANTANVTLTNLQVGSYTFKFTATDSEGNSGSDEVKVTVTGGTPSQPVVTANAGADQTVALGKASVELYGIGKGPNPFRAYLWEKVSGPSVTLTIRGANATLTNLQVGSYEFKFTATDSEGNSGSDNVKVIVTGSSARTADSSSKPTVELAPDVLTSVLVYPNPVDASLQIALEKGQPASLSITDLSGRTLYKQLVTPSLAGEITIATAEFPEGMYLLRVEQQDRLQLTKVLIKH